MSEEAFAWAVRKLSARARSEHELRKGLTDAGYTDADIEDTLRRCREYGYVDDESFAREWVRQRRALRHLSGSVLRRELTQKGVAADIQESVLAELDDNEGHVWALVESRSRRIHGLPVDKQKRLLIAFLARRGYGFTEASSVVNSFLRTLNED